MSGRWNPRGKWRWKGLVAYSATVLILLSLAMWLADLASAWAGRRGTPGDVQTAIRAVLVWGLVLGIVWATPVLGKLCRVRRERVSLSERESAER